MTFVRRSFMLLGLGLWACAGADESEADSSQQEKGSVSVSGSGSAPEDVRCEGGGVSTQFAALETEMLALVNQARSVGGVCGSKAHPSAPPLRFNAPLLCAARLHSEDMAELGFFDHDSPDGRSPFDRMKAAGYEFRAAAENIATGALEAEGVFERWMRSPGHCENILGQSFEDFGVGLAEADDGTVMWTQTFGATF